jgi:amidase
LPIGFGRIGLPLGMQIVGACREDVRTLRVAKWAEATLNFAVRIPEI